MHMKYIQCDLEQPMTGHIRGGRRRHLSIADKVSYNIATGASNVTYSAGERLTRKALKREDHSHFLAMAMATRSIRCISRACLL